MIDGDLLDGHRRRRAVRRRANLEKARHEIREKRLAEFCQR